MTRYATSDYLLAWTKSEAGQVVDGVLQATHELIQLLRIKYGR
jgi:hypothetical protein